MKPLRIQFELESTPRLIHRDELSGLIERMMKNQEISAYDRLLVREVLSACANGKLVNKE